MKIAQVAMGMIIGLWNLGVAMEHPEHPMAGGMEHKKAAKTPQQESAFQNDFEKVVKDYVASESQKTGGVFTVRDEQMKKDWKLELVKVHKNKICMLEEGKACFACADFKEAGGKNMLDLDFYAQKSADGTTTVNKVLIHKVNGKRRFTYDKNNNRVPVKK